MDHPVCHLLCHLGSSLGFLKQRAHFQTNKETYPAGGSNAVGRTYCLCLCAFQSRVKPSVPKVHLPAADGIPLSRLWFAKGAARTPHRRLSRCFPCQCLPGVNAPLSGGIGFRHSLTQTPAGPVPYPDASCIDLHPLHHGHPLVDLPQHLRLVNVLSDFHSLHNSDVKSSSFSHIGARHTHLQ